MQVDLKIEESVEISRDREAPNQVRTAYKECVACHTRLQRLQLKADVIGRSVDVLAIACGSLLLSNSWDFSVLHTVLSSSFMSGVLGLIRHLSFGTRGLIFSRSILHFFHGLIIRDKVNSSKALWERMSHCDNWFAIKRSNQVPQL